MDLQNLEQNKILLQFNFFISINYTNLIHFLIDFIELKTFKNNKKTFKKSKNTEGVKWHLKTIINFFNTL